MLRDTWQLDGALASGYAASPGQRSPATYKQSGTYDVGAENIEVAFDEATGIALADGGVALVGIESESHHRLDHDARASLLLTSGEFWIR